ncbi:hypothetical protein [Dyella sp. C11]|uniref:hypothetical protein n=1 Tax=Dyella sp. C11 TaxID=2126991 RepID=UPI000D65CDE6|nr:hypothetical protein [Dyella sp. C11]
MNPPKKPKPQINRTFHDVSEEEAANVERASILARLGWSSSLGWNTLLESKRILIISEAGAGKTYECRTQRQVLWDQGQPAFYLDLAELSVNNLRDLLSADEEARLDAWIAAQSDVATFFLDSIDELKLTLGSFETALKRLGKAVAGQLGRVRIVITTRPIAVDQQLIRQHFPVPDPRGLYESCDALREQLPSELAALVVDTVYLLDLMYSPLSDYYSLLASRYATITRWLERWRSDLSGGWLALEPPIQFQAWPNRHRSHVVWGSLGFRSVQNQLAERLNSTLRGAG